MPPRRQREDARAAVGGVGALRHETCAAHVVDDAARLLADVQIGRERRVDFSLAAIGTQPFGAIVCPPVGAQAPLPDGQPFTPPWAE